MRSKPLKIKYTDLIGTAFTPRSSARCNGIVQATVEGQKENLLAIGQQIILLDGLIA